HLMAQACSRIMNREATQASTACRRATWSIACNRKVIRHVDTTLKKGVIMKNSVRKLPLVAMLLALTVFAGKAAVQGLGLVSTTMWLYDPQRGEPTDPESYNPAPNANPDDCEGTAQVCLVSADEDANGNPDLAGVSGLIGAIESGSPHPNLAYGNFSGSN